MFGKDRIKDFLMDPSYINCNHGSYGYCPKVVLDFKRMKQEQCQFNTQKWFRKQAQIQLNNLRSKIAARLSCQTKNLFLVMNATDAINCLMKSLTWNKGDIVLLPNIAYASIKKTVQVVCQRYGVQVAELVFNKKDLQSFQSIQLKIQDFVNGYPKKIKLAIIDHVSSVPSVVFPIDSIAQFFNQKNIPLFVDGAHAVGNVHINLSDFNAAAYFSNFHKWSFAPKTGTFLYINDKYRQIVKPVITGNFYGQGPERQYFWQGTRDLTSLLSIEKSLQYYDSWGLNAVSTYNHNLAYQGALKMALIWGTEIFTPNRECCSNLACVRIPSLDASLCGAISMSMLYQQNCFLAVFEFEGKVYARISAQIYNELSDYEQAANIMLQYLNKKRQIKQK